MERYQLVLSRNAGFFSNVFSVIGALEWCAQKGLVPAVRFDSGAYHDSTKGPNWWEYFFDRLSDIDPMLLPVESRNELIESATFFTRRIVARRQTAADLIRRHIVIRPEAKEGLDRFWSEEIGSGFSIGLHLRGTDKFLEQAPPDLESAFAQIEQVALARSNWRLFVATDELRLLQQVQERFGNRMVCRDVLRSEDGQPLHTSISPDAWKRGPNSKKPYAAMVRRPGFQLGLEALQDAILLSRCNVFFGSSSCLSYFVGAFNEGLPWIHVDRKLPPWAEERQAKDDLIRELRQTASEQAKEIEAFKRESRRWLKIWTFC
jgi:hypothetical protein